MSMRPVSSPCAPQLVHHAYGARCAVLIRKRMQVVEQRRNFLVDFGVILHRAGTEWIEPVIHTEIAAGKVRIVAHSVHLRKLRQGQRL